MRAKQSLFAIALLTAGALQPASAGIVTLDFEGLSTSAKLSGKYPGSEVEFSGSAWRVISGVTDNGCQGSFLFTRQGSCGALMLTADAFDDPVQPRTSMTIKLSEAFDAFSFSYSTYGSAGLDIAVLDGNGREIDGVNGLTAGSNCSDGLLFCSWGTSALNFSGIARSIRVSGVDQGVLLDDLRFNVPTAGNTRLPEPASMALTLAALGALGWARRRAAR
jgi:hypothetical protein